MDSAKWVPVLLLPTAVLPSTPTDWPHWLWMWLLAFSIFSACKWLTWLGSPMEDVPIWKHAAYLLAWPGLDARAFLGSSWAPRDRPTCHEWTLAAGQLTLGMIVFWGIARWTPDDRLLLRGWLGMIGLVLMLHFGLFHLLSCAWRGLGIEARPLMNGPLCSVSLTEFWGKRWNTAFRDLTHAFLFRPLATRCGPRVALVLGFLLSGLLHDLVISVPAGGGYGGPTCFFMVQAGAILLERTRAGRAMGLGRGWVGWVFTMLILIGPVYWLFHPAFVHNVIVPFMAFLGEPSCANYYQP